MSHCVFQILLREVRGIAPIDGCVSYSDVVNYNTISHASFFLESLEPSKTGRFRQFWLRIRANIKNVSMGLILDKSPFPAAISSKKSPDMTNGIGPVAASLCEAHQSAIHTHTHMRARPQSSCSESPVCACATWNADTAPAFSSASSI